MWVTPTSATVHGGRASLFTLAPHQLIATRWCLSGAADLPSSSAAVLWERLLALPGFRFSSPSASLEESEASGVIVLAEDHLRDDFVILYDRHAPKADIPPVQHRALERLAAPRSIYHLPDHTPLRSMALVPELHPILLRLYALTDLDRRYRWTRRAERDGTGVKLPQATMTTLMAEIGTLVFTRMTITTPKIPSWHGGSCHCSI